MNKKKMNRRGFIKSVGAAGAPTISKSHHTVPETPEEEFRNAWTAIGITGWDPF